MSVLVLTQHHLHQGLLLDQLRTVQGQPGLTAAGVAEGGDVQHHRTGAGCQGWEQLVARLISGTSPLGHPPGPDHPSTPCPLVLWQASKQSSGPTGAVQEILEVVLEKVRKVLWLVVCHWSACFRRCCGRESEFSSGTDWISQNSTSSTAAREELSYDLWEISVYKFVIGKEILPEEIKVEVFCLTL